MPPQERKRRLRRIVLVLGIALLALVGAAAAYVVTREEGDVSNPDVEFRDEPAATPDSEQEPEEAGRKKTAPVDRFIWAHYGYTRDRRRYLPLKKPLRPPFREIWQYQGRVLLEFPPVIGGKRLYVLNDHGTLYSIDKHTGRVRWRRKLGALAAASPAYADGKVYVVLLQRSLNGSGAGSGRIVALDGRTGRIQWSRQLASRTESSPLVADGRVYFGSENGTVYAMDARDGDERWRFRAGGAVKGGLALADGRLYFGDYGGRALRPRLRQLLLHAGGRVRTRLHGQHRRSRLLLLRRRRQARLEQEHRRLRLRLPGRRPGTRRAPARLRRLLQRPLLRARRAQRSGAVVARRQREDLGRRERD